MKRVRVLWGYYMDVIEVPGVVSNVNLENSILGEKE